MISYETYKLLHLIFITTFLTVIGLASHSTGIFHKKSGKILMGILSFLIFVAGMGLIARLGFKHSEPFPLWVKLKMLNWFVVNILAFGLIKTNQSKLKVVFTILILVIGWSSIWIAINKPL